LEAIAFGTLKAYSLTFSIWLRRHNYLTYVNFSDAL